jgi:5-methylcytosine-specific restriction endonuclease McrA
MPRRPQTRPPFRQHTVAEAMAVQRRQREDGDRPSSGARGYGRRWQRYSSARLRVHRICVVCDRPAQVTDHIVPVRGPADPAFWRAANHQSLCRACHSRKTATERNGRALHGDPGTEAESSPAR